MVENVVRKRTYHDPAFMNVSAMVASIFVILEGIIKDLKNRKLTPYAECVQILVEECDDEEYVDMHQLVVEMRETELRDMLKSKRFAPAFDGIAKVIHGDIKQCMTLAEWEYNIVEPIINDFFSDLAKIMGI